MDSFPTVNHDHKFITVNDQLNPMNKSYDCLDNLKYRRSRTSCLCEPYHTNKRKEQKGEEIEVMQNCALPSPLNQLPVFIYSSGYLIFIIVLLTILVEVYVIDQ